MKKGIFICFILVGLFIQMQAQELPRRGFLGIKMQAVNKESMQLFGLEESKGIIIREVLPGSSALKAGFQTNDVLLSINGKETNSTNEVVNMVASFKGGDQFEYQIVRAKKRIQGKAIFHAFPEEAYTDLEVLYTTVKSIAGLQRAIITKPKYVVNRKLPALVFIGGIGCYSLDNPLDTSRSETRLLNEMARNGFLCVRIEKPGIGDGANASKPCEELSFTEELDGYVEAVKTLKKRNDIDSNAIFVFGHSMGGVFAPLMAQQTPLKGIIAYGTIGSNFIEHLLKTRRTIAQAYNMAPDETDLYIRDCSICISYYLIDHLNAKEAVKRNPACQEHIGLFSIRSRAYFDELYGFNIPELWKHFSGKALLVWGESDFVSSKEDHLIITDAINYYHHGHASFLSIPKADHGMQGAATFQLAVTNPGKYNTNVGAEILKWLKTQNQG